MITRETLKTIGSIRFAKLGSFFMVAVVAMLRGVAPAVYDAQMYWDGAIALVTDGDVVNEGGLGLRGVLSSLIYLPAAAVSGAFGEESAGIAVLVQNAMLLAFLGVWVLPRLAGRLMQVEARHIWVAGALTAIVCSGFASFPLMDVWAVLFLLLGILLLSSERRILLIAAGAAFAISLDLRPAFLVPVIFVAVVWTVRNWRLVVYPVAGGLAGLLPQIVFNKEVFGMWSLFAPETFAIAGIQSASASFLVRYDTVAFVGGVDPRLSYCSPGMAAIVVDAPPSSTPELLLMFAQHPIDALVFASQKVSAAVAWEWETPYSTGPHEWIGVFGVLTIVVAALGIVALVRHTLQARENTTALQLVAIWLATAATIVVSSPEARFGLPLLMVGILGCLMIPFPSRERRPSTRQCVSFAVITAAIVALVIIFASTGLANPAPPGPSSASLCDTN